MEQSLKKTSTIDTSEGKVNSDIIKKQEYLLQLKSQVKFPLYDKLKKVAHLNIDEQFKHHTKVKIIVKDKEEEKDKDYNLNNENEDNDIETIPAFIFVFADKIIITHDWIEKIDNPNNLISVPKESPLIHTIDYSHFCVFNLIVNESRPNRMTIMYYDSSFNNKLMINFKFIFLKDSYCVHHFIKKYYVLTWQRLFESTILTDYSKLIYNKHFILIKYNRWKKRQERLLLITNALIFNLGHNLAKDQLDFKTKTIKWADPIIAIKIIKVDDGKGKELQLLMNEVYTKSATIDALGHTKFMKFKAIREFEFFSNEERNEFISLLRKNYYDIKYATSKARNPDEMYVPVEVINTQSTTTAETGTNK